MGGEKGQGLGAGRPHKWLNGLSTKSPPDKVKDQLQDLPHHSMLAWSEAGVQSLAQKFKLDERAAYKLSEVRVSRS